MLGLSISEWISLAGLLGPILTFCLAAYARKYFTTQAQHKALTDRVDRFEEDVRELKSAVAGAATKDQVHDIHVQNQKVLGKVETLGAHLEGVTKLADLMHAFMLRRGSDE